MNNRFSWIFLAASGAFFVFIVGLTGYRIEDARRHNAAAARETASSLAAKVRSLADTTGSVQSPLFKNAMRGVFDSETRLTLLSLHSPGDGIVYLVTRSRSALKDPVTITPEWRGTPTYQVNRGSEILVSSALDSTTPGLTMDALFLVMGKEDLYPVVRDDLYFFLAFLLVFGVAILIVMSIEQDTGPGSARARGGASPGPSQASRSAYARAGFAATASRRSYADARRRSYGNRGTRPHLAADGPRLGRVSADPAESGARASGLVGLGHFRREPADRRALRGQAAARGVRRDRADTEAVLPAGRPHLRVRRRFLSRLFSRTRRWTPPSGMLEEVRGEARRAARGRPNGARFPSA